MKRSREESGLGTENEDDVEFAPPTKRRMESVAETRDILTNTQTIQQNKPSIPSSSSSSSTLFSSSSDPYDRALFSLEHRLPNPLYSAVLAGREPECDAIRIFWERAVIGRRPSALYISGVPGTGKTVAVTLRIAHHLLHNPHDRVTFVNCMGITASSLFQVSFLDP